MKPVTSILLEVGLDQSVVLKSVHQLPSQDGHEDPLSDGDGSGDDHGAVVSNKRVQASEERVVEVSLLNVVAEDSGQDGALSGTTADGDTVLLDDNVVVADDNSVLSLDNDGVDLEGGVLTEEGLGVEGDLVGHLHGGGLDGLSGLGGEASVGNLDLLGDLVGENGDSEDGGQAGNGEDGADDDGNLHALDRALNVGQLSLEAGHGGSSLGFHDDCCWCCLSLFYVFVRVRVRNCDRTE